MSWLGDVWDAITGLFTSKPAAAPVTPCPGSLSDADAQRLFDKLKADRKIPFDYPVDCCYARAQEMCDQMTKAGIPCGKVWTDGTLVPMKPDGTPVTFPPVGTPSPLASPPRQVIWGYHVAPTVKVTHADGRCEDMVMDPSLTDHPVSIAEWNRIMSGPGANLQHTWQTSKTPYFPSNDAHPVVERPGDLSIANRDYAFASHRTSRAIGLGNPIPSPP